VKFRNRRLKSGWEKNRVAFGNPFFACPRCCADHRKGTLLDQSLLAPAMSRALELALRGPYTGVNPQVGAVILDSQGQIISEGWHLGAGTAHAEVMAIENLKQKLDFPFPAGLTAVVTLEPCNHTGRTGPCAQALIAAGISSVVFAATDPGDASSKGSETLRTAGVEILAGFMAAESEAQGRIWLTANRNQRPFVTLKWASSLDGRAAANDGSSQWITGGEARADVHLRRSRADAILAGTGTVQADNAELTARTQTGDYFENQPLRVVLGERELDLNLRVFNDKAETVHLHTRNIHGALAELWARGIKHVFVEGGPEVASHFERLNLVDEYLTYLAPVLLGGDRVSLKDIGVGSIDSAHRLEILEQRMLGQDIFIRARRS
jgi:diaminohydroxyphosphoribosylaminopyrimidine deaminase / 5-amino-6-(5-phosphoribosylamino)uracil reductase